MPLPTAPDEYVDVDGYGMYEWCDFDWTPLMDGPDTPVNNTRIPGASGDYVNVMEKVGTTVNIDGWIHGTTLFDGTVPTSDPEARAFLRQNLAFMYGFICSPLYPATPERTLTLHGEPDWAALVQIEHHLSLSTEDEFCLKATMRITIASGNLLEAGS